MLLLLGIAFVAGIVTAISPCVLPVLPVVFAGGATGSERRPYAIVAGLVLSFTAFTLAATALLGALGLPGDFLRNVAIAVVLLVGLSLAWPRLGELLERPFLALGRRRPGDVGGGFLLGLSLGLLFTPCAGPVIAAVATLAAMRRFSAESVAITLAYALGAGVVLLALAVGARRGFALRPVRVHAPAVRRTLGGAIALVAVLMIFGVDTRLATHVPGYTRALQGLEDSAAAQTRLASLVGARGTIPESRLKDYGPAPGFHGTTLWLNSPPLTLAALRGKVVLVDFWTYSCVNCLRTLPYLERWDATYRSKGLVIVGVHTPEFSFEYVPSNVRRAVASLGVHYPVALDNDYATWNAFHNHYWPAEYFIDRHGHLRYAHFGEGEYERSEAVIRTLLAERGLPKPVAPSIRDQTPTGLLTPETYLGYRRFVSLVGSRLVPDRIADYSIPAHVPLSHVALRGRWLDAEERAVAVQDARLRLAFHARDVFLVAGSGRGPGTVDVSLDSRFLRTVRVGVHRLYTLVRLPGPARDHVLDLRFSPGIEAYSFTFG
ncbi:MAG: cytochrome c biogenesis protein DipZ [Actinobacteria bacterium]|nr:MAG: cytochrome c biogenesis protein DipZ [Actinomycetota bacterium]